MRSKAPLALIEQAVMILVFALAAALCLRAFVFSDRTSNRIEDRDKAAVAAGNAAELLKREGSRAADADEALACVADILGGTVKDGTLFVYYDGEWDAVSKDGSYVLDAKETETDTPGLAVVRVRVTDAGRDEVLFELDAAWQTPISEVN